ncbi:MAG: proline--tRNA ligase [Candidatus Bathyarchaeia archaeon]
MNEKTMDIGITVRKSEDFSEWYTQLVVKAKIADYSSVKGFMVLMPYGYAIWEMIKDSLDARFREKGHRNAYFPLLIPESLLRKEAEHFKGFIPEVFWVTHSGESPLSERLAVRPTSETIIYESFSRWIKSWRDLPLLLNVWNSVLRAEIKSTKPFIRTSEFLWQEGHTAHASKEEADREVLEILFLYKGFVEEELAIPVLSGYKSEKEKFVGALYTTTLEAVMPDGKALQMGTSHNLGQNFSKPFEIKYLGRDEKEHYAWTTSWGVSWRLIGALLMVHGDDKGAIIPPRIAPIQIVIVPIAYSEDQREKILDMCREVEALLKENGFRVELDARPQYTPGWKFNDWEMKGIPIRLEIGPKDLEKDEVTIARRDTGKRLHVEKDRLILEIRKVVSEIQENLFERAKSLLEAYTSTARDYREFVETFRERGGFVKAYWCGGEECEEAVKTETGATIRAIPFEAEEPIGSCIYCGKEAGKIVYFAKAY